MSDSHDDIVCFELGSKQPPYVERVDQLGRDKAAILRLVDDGLIQCEVKGSLAYISGVDRVGLVQLPSGRRLVIRSKIGSITLLQWLAYLGDFPPLEAWLTDAGLVSGVDLHACIAQLYLYEMDKVTRLHLRKDYTPVYSDEPTIRGRIITTQLYRRLDHLPHIPQIQRSRTFDTPYNIVLALALDKLPRLFVDSSPDDIRRLARMRDLWAHIRREIADPICAITEAQWACPPGYRAALQLARLLLIGALLDPDAGSGGQAFTLSLASIWERSLRRMVEEISDTTDWKPVPDSARTRQWDDSAGRNDSTRWLTADVMAQHENLRWVLDAKYKRAFGNESRIDRFQMCAYAVGFNADIVSLVYPLAQAGYKRRVLLDTDFGNKRLTIDSINLPMQAGPANCKSSLIELSDAARSDREPSLLSC